MDAPPVFYASRKPARKLKGVGQGHGRGVKSAVLTSQSAASSQCVGCLCYDPHLFPIPVPFVGPKNVGVCRKHYMWLRRHFGLEKASLHTKCQKGGRVPTRCAKLLAEFEKHGVMFPLKPGTVPPSPPMRRKGNKIASRTLSPQRAAAAAAAAEAAAAARAAAGVSGGGGGGGRAGGRRSSSTRRRKYKRTTRTTTATTTTTTKAGTTPTPTPATTAVTPSHIPRQGGPGSSQYSYPYTAPAPCNVVTAARYQQHQQHQQYPHQQQQAAPLPPPPLPSPPPCLSPTMATLYPLSSDDADLGLVDFAALDFDIGMLEGPGSDDGDVHIFRSGDGDADVDGEEDEDEDEDDDDMMMMMNDFDAELNMAPSERRRQAQHRADAVAAAVQRRAESLKTLHGPPSGVRAMNPQPSKRARRAPHGLPMYTPTLAKATKTPPLLKPGKVPRHRLHLQKPAVKVEVEAAGGGGTTATSVPATQLVGVVETKKEKDGKVQDDAETATVTSAVSVAIGEVDYGALPTHCGTQCGATVGVGCGAHGGAHGVPHAAVASQSHKQRTGGSLPTPAPFAVGTSPFHHPLPDLQDGAYAALGRPQVAMPNAMVPTKDANATAMSLDFMDLSDDDDGVSFAGNLSDLEDFDAQVWNTTPQSLIGGVNGDPTLAVVMGM